MIKLLNKLLDKLNIQIIIFLETFFNDIVKVYL